MDPWRLAKGLQCSLSPPEISAHRAQRGPEKPQTTKLTKAKGLLILGVCSTDFYKSMRHIHLLWFAFYFKHCKNLDSTFLPFSGLEGDFSRGPSASKSKQAEKILQTHSLTLVRSCQPCERWPHQSITLNVLKNIATPIRYFMESSRSLLHILGCKTTLREKTYSGKNITAWPLEAICYKL